jgi:hypothetical protein
MADLSLSQYELALVDAVKKNKPFIDLTDSGVMNIKRKYAPS